jgi:LytS/YehU family sensor histidine kinase
MEEFNSHLNMMVIVISTPIFLGYVALSRFHNRFMIRQLFEKRKYFMYSALSILLLFLYSAGANVFAMFMLKNYQPDNSSIFTLYGTGYFVFVGLIVTGLGLYFQFTDRWQMMRNKLSAFEQEKNEAELIALKSQMNPHFLFNSLNSIYALSLEMSDKTSESILKLSYLMSYVLHDCKKDKVKLQSELDFLESYIQLERIRYEDKIKVIFDLKVDFPDVEIAPLIFLPFVENAFKHCGSDSEEVPYVHFSMQMKTADQIIFQSLNSVSIYGSQKRNPYSGIGISNISKQIAHLYPDRHVLDIKPDDTSYSVYLKINLV